MRAPLPDNESARLFALEQYEILDTAPEVAFDDLTQLAAYVCQVPIALISLIDDCRQWFKSKVGLDATETHRDLAFCAHAILQPQDLLIVPDTLNDVRFATNALVTGEPHIRFYAGAPLTTSDGYSLGTLCVIDRVPRQLTPEQIQSLQRLSRQVIAQLELRRNLARLAQTTTELQEAEQERNQLLAQEQAARAEAQAASDRVTNILESITDAFFALDHEWRFIYINHHAEPLLKRSREELLGKVLWNEFPEAVGTTFYHEYHRAVSEQVSVKFEAFYPPFNHWSEVQAFPSKEGLSVYFRNINQRKQIEITLRETLTLQRAILDSANYSMISTTVDGIIRTFNAGAERLLGYTADEVVGKVTPLPLHDWDEIVQRAQELSQELGETIEPGFDVFITKIRHGGVEEHEWTYIRKDGSRVPVLLSATALRDEENRITGYLGIASDITARKRAEEERDRFFNLSLDLLGIAGVDGYFKRVNQSFENILGYHDAELVTHPFLHFVHPEDQATTSKQVEKLANGEIIFDFENRYRCKDGSYRWISWKAISVKEEGLIYASGRDVTEQKQAAEALRESEERFHLAFENAAIGMALVSLDGHWLQVNRNLCEMLGYSEQEMLATTFQAITHPDDLETGLSYFQRLLSGEIRSCQFEKRYLHKLGYTVWVALSISMVWNGQNRPIYIVAQIEDITDRKAAEEIQQRQNLRDRLFAEVTLKIRQSLRIEDILQTTVMEIQQLLQANRVLLFQLHSDGSGNVVQEAVVPGYYATIGRDFVDPCFNEEYLEQYRQGRIGGITDIEKANVLPCYIDFLRQLDVKANLVVPILMREVLWGLLIAHQCDRPRQWTTFEIDLLRQLADQIGIALSQAQLLEQEIQQRQELARSQEEMSNMSAALESAVEGIAKIDSHGRYVQVNPAYANMIGYEPEELIGMQWQQTVYEDDLEIVRAAYQQMIQDGKAEFEVRAIRKDGAIFDKQVVMVKAYDQQQRFIGNYCFMKDISDRRLVERLKDEFISVVSHELRTPLTSISAALDLLAEGVLQNQPEAAQQMLSIAANNSDRLVRLVNDILDIERIESGKIVMTKQVCDAADLMNQSVEAIQDMAEKAGITLSVSPVSVRLWADPDRIVQVLTNLLSNAIKFSAVGSTIWLKAELQEAEDVGEVGEKVGEIGKVGEIREVEETSTASSLSPSSSSSLPSPHVLFTVKDQGRGIPSDKLESIFERFQQVDATDSRQKGGTGLGLAICRSILQQHDGQIWSESTLGEGSTFYFTLPILNPIYDSIEPTSDLELPSSHLPLSIPPSPSLVLICDDDASIRMVVKAMLERQGYQVLTAASGQEAIEQSIAQRPDVILLNLMMPEMNGWETLAVLKQQAETQTIPVIIFSGLQPDAKEAHPEISDWIVKPPDPRTLRQALERVLASQNQVLKVLIVEDDLDLAQILTRTFSRYWIKTFHAQTGSEAIQLSQSLLPDLLVLDLGLPEQDGFAVVDWLRHHNRLCQVPLVVYTARDLSNNDRERLKLGQTLFLTKGRISPQEFEQRVINLLDRMIRGKKEDRPQ